MDLRQYSKLLFSGRFLVKAGGEGGQSVGDDNGGCEAQLSFLRKMMDMRFSKLSVEDWPF